MKIIVAKTAGFCMGVKRAMNAVIEATEKHRDAIYTLGPLVHNNQAIELLRSRNVRIISDPSEIDSGILFIRAHGITPKMRLACEKPGITIRDMTCSHVRHAQNIIEQHTAEGGETIIAGDRDHAEVVGLLGYACDRGEVVNSPEEVKFIPSLRNPCLVAQTTQNSAQFNRIEKTVLERFPGAVIHNTICSATENRQNEILAIAKEVKAVIVVGGAHSANTVRLAELARSAGTTVFHIETDNDISITNLAEVDSVGITAGASTPRWVFQAVVDKIAGVAGGHNTH